MIWTEIFVIVVGFTTATSSNNAIATGAGAGTAGAAGAGAVIRRCQKWKTQICCCGRKILIFVIVGQENCP